MAQIAADVCNRYGLTLADLRSPSRRREFAHPRQESMAEMYATGRYSNLQIAHFHRRIDHTTVVHARRAVALRQSSQQATKRVVGEQILTVRNLWMEG